jgi:hypothetical protein
MNAKTSRKTNVGIVTLKMSCLNMVVVLPDAMSDWFSAQ